MTVALDRKDADGRAKGVQPRSGGAKRSAAIYDGVVSLIVSGEFAQNARLPSESELAHRFGASRPVVREALARLRMMGSSFPAKVLDPMWPGLTMRCFASGQLDRSLIFSGASSSGWIWRVPQPPVPLNDGRVTILPASSLPMTSLRYASGRGNSASRRMRAFTSRSHRRRITIITNRFSTHFWLTSKLE